MVAGSGGEHSLLTGKQRRELLDEQIGAVMQLVPSAIIACACIVLVLLVWGSARGGLDTAALVVLFALHSLPLLLTARVRGVDLGLMRRVGPHHAGAFGSVLGIACMASAATILPGLAQEDQLVVLGAFGGLIFIDAIVFSPLPAAFAGYFLPAVAGLVMAIAYWLDANLAMMTILLILSMSVTLSLLAIQLAKNLREHVESEIAVRDQKNLVGLLLREFEENANDLLWEIDKDGGLGRVSPKFAQAFRIELSSGGQNAAFLEILRANSHDPIVVDAIAAAVEQRKSFRDVVLPISLDGAMAWWCLTGRPMIGADGEYLGYVGIGSDVTRERSAEREITKLAHRDNLTGLMNRARFNEEMNTVVAALECDGTEFCVLFLDLDKFKLINDTRGHMAGDMLLKEASSRIRENIGSADVAARLGGDEFAVILRENASAGNAARVADRLIKAVSTPYEIDGERYKVGVSVGIALAPMNGTRPTQLLRNADLALYRAKAEGRGVFRFFENQMDAEEREKRMLEQELRDAIEGDDFELVYQLQFCPHTGRATGAEALIRWNHPIRGMIHPAEFIPIAEQSSMVQEIGNWAIRKACNAALNWPDDIVVAVNISGHHFIGSDILANTKLALAETGLDARRLELEITESLLMNNTTEAMRTLRALKALGVTIALDDFGTGYSSLSYVLKFPFDKIKIDRSFVSSVENDGSAQAILRMIAGLGETLNISITAEGVETLAQAEFLRTVNCQQVQGFLYARPMRVSEIDEFFAGSGRIGALSGKSGARAVA